MSADQTLLELTGLLRSGLPANQARAELAAKLDGLAESQRQHFEVIWSLAMRLGGSVAGAIDSLGQAFAAQQKHIREVELAFAGPKATAKLVSFLPVVGLGLAQVMGMNPIGAIFTTPVGFLSVALGAVLLIAGRVWSKSILNRATPSPLDKGFYFESILVGLNAGLPIGTAALEARREMNTQLNQEPSAQDEAQLEHLYKLTQSSGASIAELIRSSAQVAREQARHLEAIKIASLSVKLMIPLGVVSLPAFILSTIAPIAISLLKAQA